MIKLNKKDSVCICISCGAFIPSGGYFKRVLYFFQGFSCSSSDGSSSDCESCKIQRSPYQNLVIGVF